MTAPLRYVFVGGFQETEAVDGSIGGQIYACRTLVASEISAHVDWIKIDSAMVSVPPPPVVRRLGAVGRRVWDFARHLRDPSVAGVLIFSSARLSFLEKGLMATLAHQAGKRVVFSSRSGLLLDDYAASPFMRRFIPFVFGQCDAIICQGASWAATLRTMSGLDDDRLVVIPNWLDVGFYEAVAAQRARRLGPATFLYLGQLEHHKGIYDLLDAVAGARAALAGCRVVVCGKGTEYEGARARVRALDLETLVELRGWVGGATKLAALAEADVLVLPSHREGMPNAVLEAMASGLAVIATRVGGVPDVIVDDREGLLVEPHEPAALGQAMAALATDAPRRARLAAAGRAHVLAHHDVRQVWPRVLALLRGGRSPGP